MNIFNRIKWDWSSTPGFYTGEIRGRCTIKNDDGTCASETVSVVIANKAYYIVLSKDEAWIKIKEQAPLANNFGKFCKVYDQVESDVKRHREMMR